MHVNAHADEVLAALGTKFPGIEFDAAPLNPSVSNMPAQTCIRVPRERLPEVMRFLRDDLRCRFEQLCDLFGVDYLNFAEASDRYAVVYALVSLTKGHRLWVKCFVNDPDPVVPSVTGVWKGAEWPEREVFDMFGVRFDGHPDLRRILTWDGFEAHPLRKDYPLRGRGEREAYRVVDRTSA
jgi:NADH-quinone oxidoreductase subunit C